MGAYTENYCAIVIHTHGGWGAGGIYSVYLEVKMVSFDRMGRSRPILPLNQPSVRIKNLFLPKPPESIGQILER